MTIHNMKLSGMILGMQKMGAKYVKHSSTHIYFDVPKGCEIDNDRKLELADNLFFKTFGLNLKIRRLYDIC